ncbi:hypothetical protein RB195_014348 [Necator americanus]|uniref:Uncharacterized protein n=1 Tax=Necator americanus TaxID=51031 RepID=A0ABR1DZP4_NECAM
MEEVSRGQQGDDCCFHSVLPAQIFRSCLFLSSSVALPSFVLKSPTTNLQKNFLLRVTSSPRAGAEGGGKELPDDVTGSPENQQDARQMSAQQNQPRLHFEAKLSLRE